MNIAIRSEADSRMLLYPLIRALYPYGTICVISNNIYLQRLIDIDSFEGGFRNIRVIVDTSSDMESVIESEDLYQGKYDFVIFDNFGTTDFDMEFIIVTSRVSEIYLQDILYVIGEPHTHVIRFGAGSGNKKKKEAGSSDGKKKAGRKKETDKQRERRHKRMTPEEIAAEEEAERNAAYKEEDAQEAEKLLNLQREESGFNPDGTIKNKWTREKTDEELLNEKLGEAKAVVLGYPSFKDIEDMESKWILPKIETKLAGVLYNALKDFIHVDERVFKKGVTTQDEGGSFISGADIR